jgi:hypothetical protein
MKKNIIFMMDIDLGGVGRWASSRRTPYKYSIDSWKQWGKKHDVDVFVLTEELVPHDYMGLCWQRYYLFDVLEANNIDYDQVLMVDADTIVHPDCPNFFEMTDRKFVGVHNDGSYDWVLRSMENYSKYMFNGYMSKWWEYIDCGFIIVNETHKQFFKTIIDYYNNNAAGFKELEKLHVGTDQTPVNLLIGKESIDLKLLPYEYNMIDLPRKELLGEDLLFTKCGWVYQYNCLPNNKDNEAQYYWMKKTYEELYEN